MVGGRAGCWSSAVACGTGERVAADENAGSTHRVHLLAVAPHEAEATVGTIENHLCHGVKPLAKPLVERTAEEPGGYWRGSAGALGIVDRGWKVAFVRGVPRCCACYTHLSRPRCGRCRTRQGTRRHGAARRRTGRAAAAARRRWQSASKWARIGAPAFVETHAHGRHTCLLHPVRKLLFLFGGWIVVTSSSLAV